MPERKIYRPSAEPAPLRKEWVSLPGGDICVWELTVAESTQVLEKSERPSVDPRGGYNRGAMRVQQVMMSCYDGEQDGAKRLFGEADLLHLYRMPLAQFESLVAATDRVNGKGAGEAERLEDFTPAEPEPSQPA